MKWNPRRHQYRPAARPKGKLKYRDMLKQLRPDVEAGLVLDEQRVSEANIDDDQTTHNRATQPKELLQ